MSNEATVAAVGVQTSEDHEIPVVLLEAREEVLPIFVSHDQAQSMQLALEGQSFERPLTHDLVVEMIADFGGAIDQVRVDSLADDTFYAKIDTEQYHGGERKELVFDARPSDAIALALRVECPITVSDAVLDAAGQPAEDLYAGDPENLDLDESEDDPR